MRHLIGLEVDGLESASMDTPDQMTRFRKTLNLLCPTW